MKKLFLSLGLILISSLFIGCGSNKENDSLPESHANAEMCIRTITVRTAEQNESKAWEVQWPTLAVTGSLGNFSNKLENAVKELSKEEAEYFINYVESIEVMESMDKHINNISKEDYEGHQYLGSVEITYDDEEGKDKRIRRYIFDEYPTGYSEFIEKFGKVCGEDYITLDYNIQEVTVDYFRRMARIGLTVPDEVIEEFLNITECDMFMLLESYNYYKAQNDIEYINTYRHLPKELLSEVSTENELKEYVTELACKFDIEESKVFEDERSGGYFFSSKYGTIEVYPSNEYPYPEYIKEYEWECSRTTFYNIQDNSGPEGMIMESYFVYSEDGKFMIIIPSGAAENVNEMIKTVFGE